MRFQAVEASSFACGSECRCSGNCGIKICLYRVNKRRHFGGADGVYKRICMSGPVPGQNYCSRCTCEITGCTQPRTAKMPASQGRWCTKYGKAMSQALKSTMYANASGTHSMKREWTLTMRLVAQWSFLLNFIVPDDLRAFQEFCVFAGATPGAAISAATLAMVFIVHSVKWPPVVCHAIKVAEKLTPPYTAEVLCQFLTELLRYANGHPWPRVFSGMNSGNMSATTGLAVQATHIGAIYVASNSSAAESHKRRKVGHKTASELRLSLGPDGKEYCLSTDMGPTVLLMAHVLASAELAAEGGLCWPTRPDEARV